MHIAIFLPCVAEGTLLKIKKTFHRLKRDLIHGRAEAYSPENKPRPRSHLWNPSSDELHRGRRRAMRYQNTVRDCNLPDAEKGRRRSGPVMSQEGPATGTRTAAPLLVQQGLGPPYRRYCASAGLHSPDIPAASAPRPLIADWTPSSPLPVASVSAAWLLGYKVTGYHGYEVARLPWLQGCLGYQGCWKLPSR